MTLHMMETFFCVAAGLGAGALAAWALSQKEMKGRLQVTEGRIKAAENRALLLKDQLEIAHSDAVLLKNRLDKERETKAVEMGELRETLQRGAMIMAGYTLGIGILFGGVVSWICTGARAEARHLQRVMDIQVESRVAQAQKEALQAEVLVLRGENGNLQRAVQNEMEQKAVALAKLEALLGGLSGDKTLKAFVSDQMKLIQELNRYTPEETWNAPPAPSAALPLTR